MYTNKARLTGLSGIDTESMIKQLMTAESAKLYKYQRSTQLLDWKQTAYRAQATNLKGFQNTFLKFGGATNMNSTATFTNYKSTVKSGGVDSTAVAITSTSGSKTADMKMTVEQIAKSNVKASAEVSGNIKSSAAVDFANLRDGDNFVFSLDGVSKTITLTQDDIDAIEAASSAGDKAQALATRLNNNQLKNAFGTEGNPQQLKVEAVGSTDGKIAFNTIKGHDLAMIEGSGRKTGKTGETTVADVTEAKDLKFSVKVGSADAIEVTASLKKDMKPADVAKAVNAALSKAGVKGLSASVNAEGEMTLSNLKSNDDITIGKDVGSNAEFLSAMGFSDTEDLFIEHSNVLNDFKIENNTKDKVDMKKSIADVFPGATDGFKFSINGVDFDFDSTDTMQKLMDDINKSEANVNMTFDTVKREFRLESKTMGDASNMVIEDTHGAFTTAFGFTDRQVAQDAKITVDGVPTTRTSNNIEVNGIKMQLNAVTTAELNISVSNDSTKTIDNIKKFVESYNKLIDEINTEVKTNVAKKNGARSYQPLTDEERKAMSESEIKLWEEKAKQGVLYNDDLLKKITSEMRSSLFESVELPNGKKLSLYELGINTSSDYKQAGKLEITDEAKLAKAIEDIGEDVEKLFTKSSTIDKTDSGARMKDQGLAGRLNDIIDRAVGTNGTIANRAGIKDTLSEGQNDILKDLTAQYKKMDDLKVYLATKENYYYSMFSKMEAAMTKSNSEMAYLTAQLG